MPGRSQPSLGTSRDVDHRNSRDRNWRLQESYNRSHKYQVGKGTVIMGATVVLHGTHARRKWFSWTLPVFACLTPSLVQASPKASPKKSPKKTPAKTPKVLLHTELSSLHIHPSALPPCNAHAAGIMIHGPPSGLSSVMPYILVRIACLLLKPACLPGKEGTGSVVPCSEGRTVEGISVDRSLPSPSPGRSPLGTLRNPPTHDSMSHHHSPR